MKSKFFLFISLFASFSLLAEAPSYEEIIDRNSLEIRTPSLASRKTAKIRLYNGLEVLIISDPDASQSAAALAMEVGSWSDPDEYPGMAHFTEHLLFMASKTYPEENGYFKQVTNNGGMLNAFTTSDRTVYTFCVNHDAFPATLDYFSHMFIDPLFSQSGVGRELHAVDQEHDKNIENDGFREYMVLKTTGNPKHPNARFATGNAETLGGIPREAVIKWYKENYSSDKAHLVLYAALPLEELKELAAAHFSAMPLNSTPKATFSERLTTPSQRGSITYITPVKEVRELGIYWELPESFFANIEDKSDALLSYILSSRHPESLYSKLKQAELIDTLYAGCHPFSKESGFYAVDFVLTPKGVGQTDQILEALFQTVNTIKEHGIPPYIFDEAKNMAKLDYEYQGRNHPFAFVTDAAYRMAEEPLETFPQMSILPTEYHANDCAKLVRMLQPKTALYSLKAPPAETGVYGNQVEKWSGAKYTVQQLDEKMLASWEETATQMSTVYPKQNPYIPSDLTLVTQKREKEETPIPSLLVDDEFGKVYFWEDGHYLVPEVSWIFSFKSPRIDRSAHQIALINLFEKCVSDHMIATSYYTSAASLSSHVGDNDYKFVLYINGFSEKAPVLLEQVIEGIKTCTWTKEEFELQRSLLVTEYENFRKASPLTQAVALLENVLFDIYPRKEKELEALCSLSYEDFLNFKAKFLQHAYAEVLLAGNMTQEDAYKTWNTVQNKLHYLPYARNEHLERSFLVLPSHCGPYKLQEKADTLGHGAILVLQEGPFSFDKNASSAILSKGISEDFFNTLRTKQQTAYIAKSTKMEEDGQLFQIFYVQSSTHQPDELIARFELFLEDYVKDFESKISEGQFDNIRTNIITLAKKPPDNLAGMAGRLYMLAFKYDGDFYHTDKKIDALAELDYETFKRDSISFISRSNSKRIAIMLEGNSPEGKGFRYQDITADELKTSGAYITWKACNE
ncbi:MAG: insulinase family protein [Simkania sp.]|nr:insulinase family protein [Simkania sp.]MCP5490871.1 insulinase family protein [Chlamydiales bacterium]